MKKKIAIGCLVAVLFVCAVFVLAGFKFEEGSVIGRREALQIALDAADVPSALAYDCRVKLDTESEEKEYTVDFKTTGIRYYYDIDAESGRILNMNREEIE